MSEDDVASLGVSEDDISSTDVSEVEDWTAKETTSAGGGAPELGEAPTLLRGYSQTYIVQKQYPQRDQAGNRQASGRKIFEPCVTRRWWVLRGYMVLMRPTRQSDQPTEGIRAHGKSRTKFVHIPQGKSWVQG